MKYGIAPILENLSCNKQMKSRQAAFVIEIIGSVCAVFLAEYLRTRYLIGDIFRAAFAYTHAVGIIGIAYSTRRVFKRSKLSAVLPGKAHTIAVAEQIAYAVIGNRSTVIGGKLNIVPIL